MMVKWNFWDLFPQPPERIHMKAFFCKSRVGKFKAAFQTSRFGKTQNNRAPIRAVGTGGYPTINSEQRVASTHPEIS